MNKTIKKLGPHFGWFIGIGFGYSQTEITFQGNIFITRTIAILCFTIGWCSLYKK